MERLTRPTVDVDVTAAKYMAAPGTIPTDLRSMSDRLLDLVINGPTLNGVNKDILRQLIRQLYAALKPYEDTGLEPEDIKELCTDEVAEVARTFRRMIQSGEIAHLQELLNAEQEGRLVVLPCKVGDTVFGICRYGKHAPFVAEGLVKEMYFANEDMRMCIVAKGFRGEWGKVIFGTREEAERAMEGRRDG